MAKHILVVDDDALMRRSLGFTLEQAGYRVSSADCAEDALALARREPPDLTLLDIGLPGMDGLDALRRFQEQADTPIIFVSARRRELDQALGLELGADDYVTKPFDTNVLLARIKAAQGNWEQAYTLLETTIKIAQTSETIIDDIHAIIHFVRLKLLQGELSQAVYWAKRYNIQARSSQMPYSIQELAQLLWFRTQVFSAGSDPRGSDQAAQDLVALIE